MSRIAPCPSAVGAMLVAGLVLGPSVPARGEWQSFGSPEIGDQRGVASILEDRSELLWFGRTEGLTTYDGLRWLRHDWPMRYRR